MANFLSEKIKASALTKTQKRIADYFLQNQEKVVALSSLEIAKEIGVSDASIIRFARAIGFEGYADLKERVFSMLVQNAQQGNTLSDRMARNRERYKEEDMMGQFRTLAAQNADSVFANNKAEEFERIVEGLIRADRRYIVGLRGCKGMAAQFGRLLSFMLSDVTVITDGECTSMSMLQDGNEGDAMLMFAFTRLYKIDLTYMELAAARNIKVFLITDDITSPLCRSADTVIMTGTSNLSFFHSTIGVDAAGEYILNRIAAKTDFENRIRERDRLTESQRV